MLLYAKLGAQIADGAHDFHNRVHFGFRLVVEERRIRLRIFGYHQRFGRVGRRRGVVGERLPYLFGDKRHERMQHSQRTLKRIRQVRQRRGVVGAQAYLRHLDVPVGVFVPEEVVD